MATRGAIVVINVNFLLLLLEEEYFSSLFSVTKSAVFKADTFFQSSLSYTFDHDVMLYCLSHRKAIIFFTNYNFQISRFSGQKHTLERERPLVCLC